jgi:hypothetical protein
MLSRGSLDGALLLTFLTALIATNVSCDSAGHPDTGAGANKTPPAVETCADLCQRLADCVVTLCDEDTSSTRYTTALFTTRGQAACAVTIGAAARSVTPRHSARARSTEV